MDRKGIVALAFALCLAGAPIDAAPQRPPLPRGPSHPTVAFNRDIRPLLAENCFACHGPDANKRQAGLRLDIRDAAIARGALVPGNPEKSPLVARTTTGVAGLRMPPPASRKSLSTAQKASLRRWIAEGARYEAHWSYEPLQRPVVPPVPDQWKGGGSRTGNPIDAFVLARLRQARLAPSPEADPVTLIRRVSFDLTGLPPTPGEVSAFIAECEAERRPPQPPTSAYERLVDRLLVSPRYGERMATYWLDLVRYANTVGYHGDQEHPISPYRDWVIKAFNDNMPFDRFTLEQLAGDLLPEPTVNQRIATGYNRLLQTTHEGGAQDREYRAKYAADRVRNVSAVWMGATLGCAECHDHKFDPYTQKDFYSLAAFFADIDERGAYNGPDASPTRRPPELEVLSPFDQEEAGRLRSRLEGLRASGEVGAEVEVLERRLDEVLKRKRSTMITAAVPPRTIRVLRRGDWQDDGGEVVTPAVPTFLAQAANDERRTTNDERRTTNTERLTRLDLARWLTGPDQPQTARVLVNRTWYLLFGAGLCRSLEDTGSQGEWPTHPELLDWMAARFARGSDGVMQVKPWDIKSLIRLIVLSSTYRQSSSASPKLLRRDPENRLLARQGRFRLPAEMIRDQALLASGLLVERAGGPSARPYQPDGYYELLNFPKRSYQADRDENQYRRGVYVHWQRQFLHPMLKAFDAPSREECTAQRPVTNTPLAALALLNDPSFVEAARLLAARAVREGGAAERDRIRWAWQVVLSRAPSKGEVDTLARLYRQNRQHYLSDPAAAAALLQVGATAPPRDVDPVELAAWTAATRALLNLSETVTRN